MKMLKKYGFTVIGLIVLAVFTGGCAQKTTIKAIKAAKVSDKSIKNIAIAPFKNDTVGQSEQIDSTISNVEIKGQKYFNVVDRNNLKAILKEKELNDSGLVNLVNNSSDSGLKQIETLVTGSVLTNSVSKSRFLEGRTDYGTCVQTSYTSKGKAYCSKYRTYNVSCQANTYTLKTKVKLIKIANAGTIFSETYDSSSKVKHCEDDSRVLPSKEAANSEHANIIAKKLVVDIAPSYVYYTVKLLEDIDVEVTDAQEKIFENALKMIDMKRIDKAHDMLKGLNTAVGSQSYTILYDYALTVEAQGDPKTALDLYKKAESIALMKEGVIDEISYAMIRVKKSIAELEKANKQLN